jgi:hypothetical protein
MFAFTKIAKTKKLLLSHVELSASLEKKLNNDRLDDPKLEQLRREKLEIELERQALLYDNLKITYPDFTSLTSEKDWWRVKKPKLSEGSVFTSKYCHGFSTSSTYTHLRPNLLVNNDTVVLKASQHCNKSLLYKALHTKTVNKKLKKLDQKFKTKCLSRTDQITLACILEQSDNCTSITLLDHIDIPNSILEPFAKETKINFIKELP